MSEGERIILYIPKLYNIETFGNTGDNVLFHKSLSRVGIELATFGLLVKRLDLSPREERCFYESGSHRPVR